MSKIAGWSFFAAVFVATWLALDAAADALICLPKHLEIGVCFNETP